MRHWYGRLRRVVLVVMAAAIVIALVVQFDSSSDRETFTAANFFSYFTVQSNILAALMFAVFALGERAGAAHRLATWARPGVTLYMTMTGVIYNVLLAPSSADVDVTEPWVDLVVHTIAPVVVLADWFLSPPARRPRYADVPWLLVYPVAYAVYSLVRGPIVDWYPYPFLDPREDGYASLAMSVAVVSLGVVAMAFALVRFTPSLRAGPTCCEPVHRSG